MAYAFENLGGNKGPELALIEPCMQPLDRQLASQADALAQSQNRHC
jgi:hypothetical protein